MCNFCEGNFEIETTIGDDILELSLDEQDKRILKIRVMSNQIGTTRPIIINNCPLCGEDLQEKNCEECAHYNMGDGYEDIEICKIKKCKYYND